MVARVILALSLPGTCRGVEHSQGLSSSDLWFFCISAGNISTVITVSPSVIIGKPAVAKTREQEIGLYLIKNLD